MNKAIHPYEAVMTLPSNGKEYWTRIMQGATTVPETIDTGSPIVQSQAEFEDGTIVIGGVAKSATPNEYNIKFMWVFDANGNQYPDWPIDTSDHEDFMHNEYPFTLSGNNEDEYLLRVVEEVVT